MDTSTTKDNTPQPAQAGNKVENPKPDPKVLAAAKQDKTNKLATGTTVKK